MHTTNDQVKVRGMDAVMYFGQQFMKEDEVFNLSEPRRYQMYKDLYFYFAAEKNPDPEFQKKCAAQTPLRLDRSIMLVGDIGVGKSILMKVMNQIFVSFRYVHVKRDIERALKTPGMGESEVLRHYGYDFKGNLLLEDVGTEETEIYLYKNKVSLIGQLLLERYDLFQDHGHKTHVITNISTDSMEDIYGERNFDRCFEMYNLMTWKGASLRRRS